MPKINQEEYEVLKEAQEEGYKWIARNYNGALIIYTSKPMKNPNLYWDSFGERMDDRLFQFIQWEDESPYNIQELIEEYEKDYKGSWEHAIEFSEEVFGESEETEVKKDIEWLIDDIANERERFASPYDDKEIGEMAQHVYDGRYQGLTYALNKIDELDEPEVLSQEWIDEHKENWQGLSITGYSVPEKDLQNLLVPKQFRDEFNSVLQTLPISSDELLSEFKSFVASGGIKLKQEEITEMNVNDLAYFITQVENEGLVVIEKPTIPQFVADWIEEMKQEERPLYSAMSNLMNKTNHEWAVWKSANKNFSEIVAQAWLDGYEVAEEQKYRVIFPSVDKNGKGFNYLAKDCYHKELWVEDARADGLAWEERSSFTEDEIRDLDKGDILFEHFAVSVEELEE